MYDISASSETVFRRAHLLVLWLVSNQLLWPGPDWWVPLWTICSVKQVMMKSQQLLEENMTQRNNSLPVGTN